MKRLLSTAIVCLLLHSLVAAQGLKLSSLIGRWEAPDGRGIEFVDSSQVYLIYGDQKKKIDSYRTDFTKSPCWFDFTLRDSSETFSLKSLMLLVHADLLQWQVFEEEVQPVHFSAEKGEIVYLRRKR